MFKKSESTVELVKRTLDLKFSGEAVSYVSFQGNSIVLDLKGFLSSPSGRIALRSEIESAKKVPLAPANDFQVG